MKDTILFVVVAVVFVVLMVGIAYAIEKISIKKRGVKERILSTRKIAMIGVMSAISGILMCLEFPLPFIPFFYELDFSELPVLICGFAYGPVAGVIAEFLKIAIKLLIKSTSTAYVGDFANFVIGTCLILPASTLYYFRKTKKTAILSLILGTLTMTIVGSLMNAFYLLPTFATMFYGSKDALDQVISVGSGVNGFITNLPTFVLWAVVPMNIIKGGAVSILTMLIYKPLRPLLKM